MSLQFFEIECVPNDDLFKDLASFCLHIDKNQDFYFRNIKTNESFYRGSKVELLPDYPSIFGKREFEIFSWIICPSGNPKNVEWDTGYGCSVQRGRNVFLGGRYFDGKLMAIVNEIRTQYIFLSALKLKKNEK